VDSGIQNEAIQTSQPAGRRLDIQLTGRHVAFLFMAAVVGSVVIFLGGVMVGRMPRRPALTPAASSTPVKTTTQAAVPAPPAQEAALTALAPPAAAGVPSDHVETASPSPEHLAPSAPTTDTAPSRRRGSGHRRARSHGAAHRSRSGRTGQ
jgi:hypothetical protein